MPDAEITVIQKRLLHLRRLPVILDSDLAAIYGVTTGALNQAIVRNAARFPADFSFIVNIKEFAHLKSQNVISSTGHGGRRKPPRVFTEHGALMASTVLRSDQAIGMSVFVIRAFVQMREELATNQKILKRLAEIDQNLLTHDTALRDIYQKLLPLLTPPKTSPKRKIGFNPDSRDSK
jgi:hypothetical protein